MKPNNEIVAELIIGGVLRSLNYDGPDGGETFADAGSEFNLNTGSITTTALYVDGVTGSLSVRGSITATALTMLHPTLGHTVATLASTGYIIANTPALRLFTAFGDEAGAIAWEGSNTDSVNWRFWQQAPSGGRSANRIDLVSTDTAGIEGDIGSYSNAGGELNIDYRAATAAGTVNLTAFGLVQRLNLNSQRIDLNATGDRVYIGGTNILQFASYGGGWYMSDTTWIRAVANKNIYTAGEIRAGDRYTFDGAGYKFTNSTDTDTGLYYDSDGVWRLMSNGGTELHIQPNIITIFNGHRLRLYDSADDNHHLRYSSDAAATIHPLSGVSSNGPWLQGYATVCLRTVLNSRTWLFDSSGNAFTPNSWTTYSSRRDKRDVEQLDPADALRQVRRWRPVRYSRISDGVSAEGFIAEEMHAVTPHAVTVADDGPNGIDYGKLTVQLAGAVAELAAQLDAVRELIGAGA